MFKMMQRTEASNIISEFNLTEVGKEKVKLNELIKTLKKSTAHSTVKKQLKNASQQKILPVPLSKPQADKIKRTVAYEKVSEEVKKWDSIVHANRVADQVVYPLRQPEFHLETTEEVAKRFRTKNALEEEVAKLLNKSENVLDQKKVLTVAEEKALKAMSLTEAKARHAELRKMRTLLSFKEAKARRLKKIKSKKYHRILKREKMHKLMKEFEVLQKADPEAAEEKIKEADKLRILERMTLKHKSTGKWAKQQKLRAKYNVESRTALKEQLSLSRHLTEKIKPTEESDNFVAPIISELNDSKTVTIEEDDELLNMYRINCDVDEMQKVNDSHSKQKENLYIGKTSKKMSRTLDKAKPNCKQGPEVTQFNDECQEENEPMVESVKRKQNLEDFENEDELEWPLVDSSGKEEPDSAKVHNSESYKAPKEKASTAYVSETDFSSGTKILDSLLPDDVTFGDEGVDDVEEDRMDIRQAFADEDFIAEFNKEKRTVEKKEKPERIDLSLPGWGCWAGAGIRPSKRKRRRFYVKPVDIQPRKDSTLGNVIISEEKDSKASVHQVSDIPFPYKCVDAFQSMIRQPVGSTWNPETSFQKMIAPKVVTKMGKIIDPMDKEDLVLEKNPHSSSFNSRNKKSRKNQSTDKQNRSLGNKSKNTNKPKRKEVCKNS